MEAKEKIIVALDVSDVKKASDLVEQLAPHVGMFKIGLEFIYHSFRALLAPESDDSAYTLRDVRRLFRVLDGNIFLDTKLNDIPNTVKSAAREAGLFGTKMFNIHCLSGMQAMSDSVVMINSMVEKNDIKKSKKPLIIGVTFLTSLQQQDLHETGLISRNDPLDDVDLMIKNKILHLAWLAYVSGLDGVVCSPKEIRTIREYKAIPETFKIVTPGIRPVWASVNDQKRMATPAEAIKDGADYLVIGRPITNPPSEIGGPVEAAKRILEEISAVG